jgi:5'-deoxynucleotidase YfbR-like HD superfamily hydrolase
LAGLADPHLDNQVDIAKVLKMIVCHNLVEALVGDIPFLRLAIARA